MGSGYKLVGWAKRSVPNAEEMRQTMYFKHPSLILTEAFVRRPFQGAEPESARFIFIGLDANYDAAIEKSPIFQSLLDYLENGVTFWQKHKVHHPFLLPSYSGDGRFYHKSFASIGFTPELAEDISFVELLHVPTYGKSSLKIEDLNHEHLQRVNNAILRGRGQFIFIPDSVGRLMKASGCFPWLPKKPISEGGPLKVWLNTGSKIVYWHYHFSVYGRFDLAKQKQLRMIATLAGL